MKIRVEEFVDENGVNPFREWFDNLSKEPADRVEEVIERMRMGNMGDVKSLRDGVWERRIHSSEVPIRIYFGYGNDNRTIVILLAGGTKKQQKRDIRIAKQRWQEHLSRQAG